MRGTRIVLINTLEPALTNAHMGATVFGNYRESIENDWNIPGRAESEAEALLSGNGDAIVKVDLGQEKLEQLRKGDHISRGWSSSKVDRAYSSWFQEIMDQNDASAVVILRSIDAEVAPNSVATYGGYGILSFMGFKPDNALLFSLVGAEVFSGNPVVFNRDASPFKCRKLVSTASIAVENLKYLTADQLTPFRTDVEKLVDHTVAADLAASGLIGTTVAPCELER